MKSNKRDKQTIRVKKQKIKSEISMEHLRKLMAVIG